MPWAFQNRTAKDLVSLSYHNSANLLVTTRETLPTSGTSPSWRHNNCRHDATMHHQGEAWQRLCTLDFQASFAVRSAQWVSTQSDHYAVLHHLLLEVCWILALEAQFPGHFGVFSHLFSNIFHWFHIILVLHAYWGYFYVYFNDVTKGSICGSGVKVAAELVRLPGLLFYFLGLCLSPTVWNDRWMDIHEISGYGHKQQLDRLFHAWLDSFALLKLGML